MRRLELLALVPQNLGKESGKVRAKGQELIAFTANQVLVGLRTLSDARKDAHSR